MAVLKAKPQKFIQYLFPLLERELVVPLLTTRVADDTFTGAQGDTVTMKVGKLIANARDYEFRTRTAPIVMDDISGGGSVDIKLDQHLYSATSLTDEQLTLDEIELTADVLQPQAEAVAGRLEDKVIAAYAAMATREEIDFVEGDADTKKSDPYKVAVQANRLLSKQKRAPKAGRVWLVGSAVAEAILLSDRFSKYDLSGDTLTGSALRDATIGKIGGLQVVSSDELDEDFSVVTHSSSLVLGTVAPVAPRGAAYAARASKNGFGMRWLFDYDANYQRDRATLSMFAGLSVVYDEIFLSGTKKGQVKTADDYTGVGSDVPKSARAVKVNFTPAA